jgi:hypothetical protein
MKINRLFLILLAFICLISLVKNNHNKKLKKSTSKLPLVHCTILLVDNDFSNSRDDKHLYAPISCNKSSGNKNFALNFDLKNDLKEVQLISGIDDCECIVQYTKGGKTTGTYNLKRGHGFYNTKSKDVDLVFYECNPSQSYKKKCDDEAIKLRLAAEAAKKKADEKRKEEIADKKERDRLDEIAMIFPKPNFDKDSITGLKCPTGWKYVKSIPYIACYNSSDLDAKKNKDYLPMWRGSKKASYCCIKDKLFGQQNCEGLGLTKDTRHWKRCPIANDGKIDSLGNFSYEGCYIVSNKQCCVKSGKDCNKTQWDYGVKWSYNMLFEDTDKDNVTSKFAYDERIQWEITKGLIKDNKEAKDFHNYDCKKNQEKRQQQPFRR